MPQMTATTQEKATTILANHVRKAFETLKPTLDALVDDVAKQAAIFNGGQDSEIRAILQQTFYKTAVEIIIKDLTDSLNK